jgi:hypothetical protein
VEKREIVHSAIVDADRLLTLMAHVANQLADVEPPADHTWFMEV